MINNIIKSMLTAIEILPVTSGVLVCAVFLFCEIHGGTCSSIASHPDIGSIYYPDYANAVFIAEYLRLPWRSTYRVYLETGSFPAGVRLFTDKYGVYFQVRSRSLEEAKRLIANQYYSAE